MLHAPICGKKIYTISAGLDITSAELRIGDRVARSLKRTGFRSSSMNKEKRRMTAVVEILKRGRKRKGGWQRKG